METGLGGYSHNYPPPLSYVVTGIVVQKTIYLQRDNAGKRRDHE
jgi:hypothetical protein